MEHFLIFLFAAVLAIWIAWRDWKTRLIDDRESGALLALALLGAFLEGGAESLSRAAIGAGLLFGLLFGVRFLISRVRGVEALGQGDVGLGLACGALVGWPGIPLFLVVAGLLGMVVSFIWRKLKSGDEEAPFAPAMLASAFMVVSAKMFGVPVGIVSFAEYAHFLSWLGY